MKSIRFTSFSKLDLQDIYFSTKSKWGEDQAYIYIEEIFEALDAISEFSKIGKPQKFLIPSMRFYKVNKHSIFYLELAKTIKIIAILHERMLIENYIKNRRKNEHKN